MRVIIIVLCILSVGCGSSYREIGFQGGKRPGMPVRIEMTNSMAQVAIESVSRGIPASIYVHKAVDLEKRIGIMYSGDSYREALDMIVAKMGAKISERDDGIYIDPASDQ